MWEQWQNSAWVVTHISLESSWAKDRSKDICSCPIAEVLAVEEEVAQSLLELKESMRQEGTRLQQLDDELQNANKEDACLQARL